MLTILITGGTILYHILMRFLTGFLFQRFMHNKADYRKKWYQVSRLEQNFYEKIKVKQWKNKMPTFDPGAFDPKNHTWSEIAQAMCQAELVHETIIVLSFLPIAEGIWFGDYPVFILTSVMAAMIDLMFVMIQRYNRQRIMKILQRSKGAS